MSAIVVLLIILFITGIGYAGIRSFGLLSKKDNISAIAYSYGLGVGLISMQLYLYSRLNIPWYRELLIFPWIILLAGFLFKNKKKLSFHLLKISNLKTRDKLLFVGILITLAYVTLEALIRPVTVWDAWASWLLRSNIFYIDGRIPEEMLLYLKVDYPLVISLMGTFIYLMLGQIDDTAVLLTSVAFYTFLALLFFSVLKKRFGTTYALLFTFLMVTVQNFVRHGGRLEAGQADLPLGYYAFSCVMLLFDYIKNNNPKTLLLLSIFLGITGLIKSEGVVLTMIIGFFVFLHIYKNKFYRHLLLFIFWLGPIFDWQIYKKMYNLDTLYFSSHHLELSIHKTITSFTGTFKELINIKSWSLLWITYFYSLFIFSKIKSKELFILNSVIIFQLSFYMVMYNFTAGNSPESSIERLLMHIAPLALFAIALRMRILFRQ